MFSTYWNVSYVVLLLQLYLTDLYTMPNKGPLRVMGGRDAAKGEFPYVMRLEFQRKVANHPDAFSHFCTCSLLKPTWSLTAAHCIKGLERYASKLPKRWAVIRYDLLNTNETGTSRILSSVMYPSFENMYTTHGNKLLQNDIGLPQSENVPVNKFAKISSVDYSILHGHQVLAVGYGTTLGPDETYDVAVNLNKSLQVLDVIVAQCTLSGIVNPTFCVMGRCGEWSAVCSGDSGGPVLHPSGVVGVNTATDIRNCKKANAMWPHFKLATYSGQITPVSPFIDWITKLIS